MLKGWELMYQRRKQFANY